MANGQLVPDDLIINMVLEKINSDEVKKTGWLLDGFPRTAAQVQRTTFERHSSLAYFSLSTYLPREPQMFEDLPCSDTHCDLLQNNKLAPTQGWALFDAGVEPDAFILLEVPDEVGLSRNRLSLLLVLLGHQQSPYTLLLMSWLGCH